MLLAYCSSRMCGRGFESSYAGRQGGRRKEKEKD